MVIPAAGAGAHPIELRTTGRAFQTLCSTGSTCRSRSVDCRGRAAGAPRGPGGWHTSAAVRNASSGLRIASARGRADPTWLKPREVERYCAPDAQGEALLKTAFARLSLSARAYHRILKVARTVADLAAAEAISPSHVAEAIGYRRLDRT